LWVVGALAAAEHCLQEALVTREADEVFVVLEIRLKL